MYWSHPKTAFNDRIKNRLIRELNLSRPKNRLDRFWNLIRRRLNNGQTLYLLDFTQLPPCNKFTKMNFIYQTTIMGIKRLKPESKWVNRVTYQKQFW